MADPKTLIEEAEKGHVSDFDQHFQSGRRSEYSIFRDRAEDLDPGESLFIGTGVRETTVSSIRNQVYKSNPEDAEDKKYVVEMSSKNETDEDGNDLYNVRIYHNKHFYTE